MTIAPARCGRSDGGVLFDLARSDTFPAALSSMTFSANYVSHWCLFNTNSPHLCIEKSWSELLQHFQAVRLQYCCCCLPKVQVAHVYMTSPRCISCTSSHHRPELEAHLSFGIMPALKHVYVGLTSSSIQICGRRWDPGLYHTMTGCMAISQEYEARRKMAMPSRSKARA